MSSNFPEADAVVHAVPVPTFTERIEKEHEISRAQTRLQWEYLSKFSTSPSFFLHLPIVFRMTTLHPSVLIAGDSNFIAGVLPAVRYGKMHVPGDVAIYDPTLSTLKGELHGSPVLPVAVHQSLHSIHRQFDIVVAQADVAESVYRLAKRVVVVHGVYEDEDAGMRDAKRKTDWERDLEGDGWILGWGQTANNGIAAYIKIREDGAKIRGFGSIHEIESREITNVFENYKALFKKAHDIEAELSVYGLLPGVH